MAKKRQTTGLPKSAKKRETQEVEQSRRRLVKPLREYKSRAEREAAIQRWVIVGVVTAIVAVLIVLAATLTEADDLAQDACAPLHGVVETL
jgi:hypothetical protein